MTSEQKVWLDANPQYRPVGIIGGHAGYVGRGVLYPDGRFEPVQRGHPKPIVSDGAFTVGILAVRDPNEPWKPGDPAPVVDPRTTKGSDPRFQKERIG